MYDGSVVMHDNIRIDSFDWHIYVQCQLYVAYAVSCDSFP